MNNKWNLLLICLLMYSALSAQEKYETKILDLFIPDTIVVNDTLQLEMQFGLPDGCATGPDEIIFEQDAFRVQIIALKIVEKRVPIHPCTSDYRTMTIKRPIVFDQPGTYTIYLGSFKWKEPRTIKVLEEVRNED